MAVSRSLMIVMSVLALLITFGIYVDIENKNGLLREEIKQLKHQNSAGSYRERIADNRR